MFGRCLKRLQSFFLNLRHEELLVVKLIRQQEHDGHVRHDDGRQDDERRPRLLDGPQGDEKPLVPPQLVLLPLGVALGQAGVAHHEHVEHRQDSEVPGTLKTANLALKHFGISLDH